MSTKVANPITFTEEERMALYSDVISMWQRLKKDKHVHPTELEMWYQMGEKLRKAKIWDSEQ
jgi:hypothetical protein